MNNLYRAQNAWLRSGAPQDDPDVCLNTARNFVSVCYPDIGNPGYLVLHFPPIEYEEFRTHAGREAARECILSLSGDARAFTTFGEAMDYAATIA